MTFHTPRDWWEGLNREELQAKVKQEAPRMSASKIGQWRDTNSGWEPMSRTRRRAVYGDDRDEGD